MSVGIVYEGGKKNLWTLLCSTYSIFIPPFGDAMTAIDPDDLSNKNER